MAAGGNLSEGTSTPPTDKHLRESNIFHNVLHGFCVGRGMGTAILEFKLAQYLSSVNQEPIFLGFLYLRKSTDTMDRGRLLMNLEGYGAGPHM